jgi:hypothetical protein
MARRRIPSLSPPNGANPTARAKSEIDKTWGKASKCASCSGSCRGPEPNWVTYQELEEDRNVKSTAFRDLKKQKNMIPPLSNLLRGRVDETSWA